MGLKKKQIPIADIKCERSSDLKLDKTLVTAIVRESK